MNSDHFTHKEVVGVGRVLQLVCQKILARTSLYEVVADRQGVRAAPGSLECYPVAEVRSFSLEARSGIELAGVVVGALSRCSLEVRAMSRRQL